MLKTLFKKQFLEINAFYFQDRKTGKIRSKKGIIGFVILFAFIFLSVAASFFGMASLFSNAFLPIGLDWLYFSMFGMMSIGLGVFGSAFNTFASLYLAKDNEMLLSMPIPPSYMLISRVASVSLTSLLYSSLVWIPIIIRYWMVGSPSAVCVLFNILMMIVITLLVTILTCALGWIIAQISNRLKGKSILTVLISLLVIGGYYVLQFKLNSMLQDVALNGEKIGSAIKNGAYPMYIMGLAAAGDGKSMLMFTLGVILICAAGFAILSKTFIRVLTGARSEKRTVYKEKTVKSSDIGSALLRKELYHFSKSSVYMLNGGLGLAVLPVTAAAALIKGDVFNQAIAMFTAQNSVFAEMIPLAVTAIVCTIVSMNAISSPSVSLEGKNIWILQSLPAGAEKVLKAKEKLPVILNTIPAIFCTAVLCIVLGAGIAETVAACIFTEAYIFFNAAFGLAVGTKKPTMEWTNETVPIKQGIAIVIVLFGGMIISFGTAALYYPLSMVPVAVYMLIMSAVFIIARILIDRWIYTKGAKIFEEL